MEAVIKKPVPLNLESQGTIIIRDEDKQKQDIANLDRSPDGKNQALEKPPEKEIVFEKEQAAAIFGEIGFETAGKLAEKFGWKEGDPDDQLFMG